MVSGHSSRITKLATIKVFTYTAVLVQDQTQSSYPELHNISRSVYIQLVPAKGPLPASSTPITIPNPWLRFL